MSWKDAANELKQKLAVPPPGTQTIEEIAAELNLSVDRALDMVKRLIKEGRAEAVPGKRLSPTGALTNCFFYRLLPKAKKAK
jgi:DNA-binding Lrp family transcriptional regulator